MYSHAYIHIHISISRIVDVLLVRLQLVHLASIATL